MHLVQTRPHLKTHLAKESQAPTKTLCGLQLDRWQDPLPLFSQHGTPSCRRCLRCLAARAKNTPKPIQEKLPL